MEDAWRHDMVYCPNPFIETPYVLIEFLTRSAEFLMLKHIVGNQATEGLRRHAPVIRISYVFVTPPCTHARTRTRARSHARTHAHTCVRMHARTHARTHAHTHTSRHMRTGSGAHTWVHPHAQTHNVHSASTSPQHN